MSARKAKEQPEHASVQVARWAWRYRSELAPLWAALGLVIVCGVAHALRPGAWPIAMPAGVLITLAVGRLKSDRLVEEIYVLAVGAGATAWGTVAWWASPAPPALLWTLVIGGGLAAVPWWGHHRRRVKVRVRRLITEDWPEVVEAAGLPGCRVQRADVDHVGSKLRLALRRGQTVADVLSKIPQLESALGTRPGGVRVTPDAQRADRCHLQVVDREPLARPIPWPGPTATTITAAVALGLFEDRSPVLLELQQGGHTLIAGSTGYGKSGLLNVVMGHLAACEDCVAWGIDPKGGMELAPWRGVLDRLATTPEATTALLTDANRILDARAQLLAGRGRRSWKPSPGEPLLVVVIDELAELGKNALLLVDRIARLGRAPGVQLLVCTQRPSARALEGAGMRAQLSTRIAMKVNEVRDSELILGQGRAASGWRPDRLPGEFNRGGWFLISSPPVHTMPRTARAYLVTDQAVRECVRANGSRRPALDLTSSAAAGADAPLPPVLDGDDQDGDIPDDGAESVYDAFASPAAVPAPPPPPSAATDVPPRGTLDADAALRAALRDAPPEGVRFEELPGRVGRSRNWVHSRLLQLDAAGLATKVARGRWRAREGRL